MKTMFPNSFSCALLLVGLAVVPIRADLLVVPQGTANVPGEGSQVPFGASDTRYLNVYNPSEFLSTLPGGGIITGISFRIDEIDRESFTAVVPDVEVRLSTSPSTAPVLPLPFASNVGPDETVVFPRSSIQFSIQPSASGPNPFLISFPFKQPFAYDPRKGGLTVDLRTYEGSDNRLLTDAGGEGASAIVGSIENPLAFGGRPALIMQLEYQQVPEPAASLCIVAGIALFYLRRRK